MGTERSRTVVSKTEAVSANGMVTAMHPLAAEAGVEILRDAGGNAADAAIATALAAGVVEPFMSGLGGCAYAVAYDAASGAVRSFDGSAVTPAGVRDDMFELAGDDAPRLGLYGWPATVGDAAETGYRSTAVPGALAALDRLHAFSGTLPWRELVAPARKLAEEGFLVDDYFFAQSALSESRLRAFPETTALFYRADGTAKPPSFHGLERERLRQPELASTLELLGREGPRVFYRGEAAEEVVSFLRERGGVLSSEDLRRYEAREGSPARVRYHGEAIELLPGASGGITVAMALELLEAFPLDGLRHDDPGRLHLVVEALRLAFADRFRFLADPDSELVPLEALFSQAYAAERRKLLNAARARAIDAPPGDPWSFQGEPPGPKPNAGDAPDQHTTHLNVVDRKHNMVALTATLGARYGSGVTVPSLGVVLNNGMMWFDPVPGRLNSIRPGKRALHAAAPCLVFHEDGRPRLALGSPGARRIMSSVLQVLLSVVDQRMGIQEAILAPRLHVEAEGPVEVDARFAPEVAAALRDRGHVVVSERETFLSSYFGRPSGVLVDHADGVLRAGVEPYRVSAAVGF